ncbi:WAS protein family like 2 [Pseudolycoriella hygida]|uniref:WAS protein family like 2 n=1 Tax=Pseudolycoriella hygida TaxID=35572 RepID=A0A9Q0RVH8_9DIPT|nr:WAS protein family like 2 [Pseudolycoriella hygida]
MDLYDIPVIQPDLRHEETIIQIANAFNALQQVITDVFNKVDERIESNSKVVQDIDMRIERVNKKIEKLSNDYESIDIQSPYDYPAEKAFKNIPMTLTKSNRKAIELDRDYTIESGPDCNISKTYDKKLQFYYVRQSKNSGSSAGSVSSKETYTPLKSGLGSVPSYLDSINALLLFNNSENVFDSKTQKNLRRMEKSTIKYYDPVLSDGPGDIEKAPESITTRQLLNMRIRKHLFMATQWNDDEQIDIPIMLPNVSGIRDKKKKKITKSSEDKLPENTNDEPKSAETKAVLPHDGGIQNTKKQDTVDISSSVVDSAPAPPPVPPPVEPSEVVTPKAPPPKLNSNTQDRSMLMEAIRQAGGAQKMKKKINTEQRDDSGNTEKKKQPVAFSSGGLMDDLHKKLALRRKGISGNKDLGQGSNVMEGISAMIPPPPPKQSDSSSESESNDDWN